MKSMLLHLAACAVLVVFVCGITACQTQTQPVQGPFAPLKQGTSLEETETLVLLDQPLQAMISVDSQRAGYNPEGRLVAEAIIRNNYGTSITIQAQTVFKDAGGFSSGDETAWQTLILQPNAQAAYKAAALNVASAKYTIRIRMER